MIEEYPIKLVQSLGDQNYNPQQHLDCFQYSKDGGYFALGDESGLLHVFQYIQDDWVPVACFRAHSESHDQQKNQAIECRVSLLKWLDSSMSSLKILTANYRFIKIWRLKDTEKMEVGYGEGLVPTLIPLQHSDYRQNLLLDYRYVNQVTHLDLSHNDEYVITATRSMAGNSIQKWSLQKINKSIILWEKKREESIMEEEDELWDKLDTMCALKFHLQRDNCYCFSTKYGDIKYIDSRFSYSKPNVIDMKFTPYQTDKLRNSTHTKYLEVISDFQFLDDHSLVARDYFNYYLWDLRKSTEPVSFKPVFKHIYKHITQLITRFDDRFKIDVRGSDIITSFYGNTFHKINLKSEENIRVKIDDGVNENIGEEYALSGTPDEYKPRELSFHPNRNEIGVTYRNKLDIYNY